MGTFWSGHGPKLCMDGAWDDGHGCLIWPCTAGAALAPGDPGRPGMCAFTSADTYRFVRIRFIPRWVWLNERMKRGRVHRWESLHGDNDRSKLNPSARLSPGF